MASSDPLLALRQAIKDKTQIILKNAGGPCHNLAEATEIQLSDTLTFPKSTPTRLQKPAASSRDPTTNPNDFVTLDTIYLAWIHREASGADYMRQARENGLLGRFVSVTERKGLIDWLEGRSSHHDRIVPLSCGPLLYSLVLLSLRTFRT